MPRMEVHLVTPERELWRGEATMVVARGTEGEVGILAGHAPMLLQLGIGPVFIHTGEERIAAAVDGGFLHVVSSGGDSRVDVLAEHAELREELDRGQVNERLQEAERRLAERGTDDAVADLNKARTRMDLLGSG